MEDDIRHPDLVPRAAQPSDGAVNSLLLTVDDVTMRFSGVLALDSVSFSVRRGQICGLIGPNGAGKTTLFNCLSRLNRSWKGEIFFDGHRLSAAPTYRTAVYGIGRTFQNLALCESLTVLENIMLGGHSRTRGGFIAQALSIPVVRGEERFLTRRAYELSEFVNLRHVVNRMVGDLPFGFRKRVELARALASEPKLLLLDEPAAGLNRDEIDQLRDLIWRVRDELGVTTLLVEHHMRLVMSVSDNVVALNFGRKIAEGPPAIIQKHPDVISAYLGDVD
jgi:branched-chain amino acid transport system ATP-binding protein